MGRLARIVQLTLAAMCTWLASCRDSEPIFVESTLLEEAEILLLLVLSDGVPVLSRSAIVLPNADGSVSSARTSLDEEHSLVLVTIDEVALQRGAPGVLPLRPDEVKLHEASEVDCGPRGADVTPSAMDEPRLRQPLHRFAPTLQRLEPGDDAPVSTTLAALPSVGAIELELPVEPEPCRSRLGLRLVPFTEGGVFPRGPTIEDPAGGAPLNVRTRAPVPFDDDHYFLESPGAMFFVRRGFAFDPAVDRLFRARDFGLRSSGQSDWVIQQSLIEPGPTPSARRLLVLLREFAVSLDAELGWALAELPFDGLEFGTPRLRHDHRVSVPSPGGGAAMAKDASGAIVVVGLGGSWAVANSIDEDFAGGLANRGDLEAIAGLPRADRPHVVASRGGNLGFGDVRRPDDMEFHRVRTESSAIRLFVVREDGQDLLYSAWKDGRIFRTPSSGDSPSLEVVPVEVPRRLEQCLQTPRDSCGRAGPAGWTHGATVLQAPGREPLLLSVYADCPSVLVHELSTGCTTSVEFPNQRPDYNSAMSLRLVGGHFFATDGDGVPFELEIDWP